MNKALLGGVLLSVLTACSGGGGSPASGTLQSISVTPGNAAIGIGQTLQFTARGKFSDGSQKNLTAAAAWASTAGAVAGVDAAGVGTGVSQGSTTISATVDGIVGSTTLSVAPPIRGTPTVWNFDDPQNPLASRNGTAALNYRDPGATGWGPQLTRFATASKLKLPLINGQDTGVMSFPATHPDQGYTITHNSPGNGVFEDGTVSNYSLVMDVLWPDDSTELHRAILQTNEANADDADMFVKTLDDGTLGLGVSGVYNQYGSVTRGTWHRIAIVVQCALGPGGTGLMQRYIDGLFVGGGTTPEQTPGVCRWTLGDTFHVLTDDDYETAHGYLASMMYIDRILFPDEIAALGGPNASGADVPGAPAPPPPQVADRRVIIVAHRTQSGSGPENTAEGITKAFDAGADAAECDLRNTANGTLMLMHDPSVDRTTDGTGDLSSLTDAQAKALDAGFWYDSIFAGVQVPTFVEALTAAKGRGHLLLDVKGYHEGARIKQALIDAGVAEDQVWPSQNVNTDAAADFQAYEPNAGILWGDAPATLDQAAFDDLKARGVVGFDMPEAVTPEFLDAAHANGLFVIVFTVYDPDDMLRLIALGVDGMETDYPAVLDSLMPPPLSGARRSVPR